MKKIIYIFFLMALGVSAFYSCKGKTEKTEMLQVEKDTTFIKQLFVNDKNSITGGDGCISIEMEEGKSLFLWGDSFIGGLKDDNTRDSASTIISGNVFQIVDNNGSTTILGGTGKHPTSVVLTDSVNGHYAALWPEHGIVKNNILHQFFAKIAFKGTGTWDFYFNSLVYCRLSADDFKVISEREISMQETDSIHFGFALIEYGDYIYTYGTRTKGIESVELHIARTKLVNDELQALEFYDGNGWNADPKKSKALQGVDANVSEQFSVFKYDEHFVLLTQNRWGGEIHSFTSRSMLGPWGNKRHIYTTTEAVDDPRLFTYNAMAHPQYIKDGKLPVSYCVNSHEIKNLYPDASIYAPRFLWVKMNDIIK